MTAAERILTGWAARRVELEREALRWAYAQRAHFRTPGTAELIDVCREDLAEARASQRRLLDALGLPWHRRPAWLVGAIDRAR